MKGKLIGLISAFIIAAIIFTACSSGNETNPESSPSPVKDEVIIGFTSMPAHFDPIMGFGTDGQLIFSTLVETDADMNIIPELASEYHISEDAKTYTFKLRNDASFTDGQPVKASDVAFTFNKIKETPTSIDLSAMQECKTEGDDTIVIELSRPSSTFILNVTQIGIVPEHLYNADFALNPVGSGPFKLVQYDVDQQFILEANEDYYGKVPEIRRVVFVMMNDEDTRLAAIKSGQVDITPTSAVIASVNEIPGYYLMNKATVDNMGIAMPVLPDTGEINQYGAKIGNNVTSDIAIRKAIAYGIDREKICQDALSGFASPAYSENDGMPWWNPDSIIKTDVEYAVSLLEEAGWTDTDGDGIREKEGLKASLTLMYFAGDSVRQAVAMSVSQQAKAHLGIEIVVEGVGDDIASRMYSEPMILAWGSSNPMTSYRLFHSQYAGLDDWYNPENFRSETVDLYLEQALESNSIEESVPFWQKAQWDGTTGTSMKGCSPYIFLINKNHLYWVREGLDTGKQRIHAHGDAWPLVANLKEWKWK